MNREDAQTLMNSLGGKKEPFFFMIDFEMENIVIHSLEKFPSYISFDFKSSFSSGHLSPLSHADIKLSIVNFDKQKYAIAFEKVIKELKYGNSFLLNLTSKIEVRTSHTLYEIFQSSFAPYRILYKDKFVCFSPESFVKIEDNIISTYPMKGTIDADIPKARELILEDKKETYEHNTIVDLLRNDLSMVSEKVTVHKYRYIEEIKTIKSNLLQVSSAIRGQLDNKFHQRIGNIIFALLPAGSISGAPKKKTVSIIQEAESEPRGYYTGVSGVFDGERLDSCVMIRFLEKQESKFYYRSGGGITAKSNLEYEYQETKQKIYVPTH